jgi:hypothetical protein
MILSNKYCMKIPFAGHFGILIITSSFPEGTEFAMS